MKHLIFPTKAQADAFIQDLQTQGLAREQLAKSTLNRDADGMSTTGGMTTTGGMSTTTDATMDRGLDMQGDGVGGTPEDAGAGAVKGTGVGAVVGAAAAAIGVAATGGALAVPLLLGWAALGSGVGAAVGAAGGAAGVDETGRGDAYSDGAYDRDYSYNVNNDSYDRLSSGLSDGRAVAVEDSVPEEAVRMAASRHGGEIVS